MTSLILLNFTVFNFEIVNLKFLKYVPRLKNPFDLVKIFSQQICLKIIEFYAGIKKEKVFS